MSREYPIPPDGEILRSRDLRELALYIFERTGGSAIVQHGFARDPKLDAVSPANAISIESGCAVITGMAILTPDGALLLESHLKTEMAGTPGQELWAVRRVPQHREPLGKPAHPELALQWQKPDASDARVSTVRIGRLVDATPPRIEPDLPAVTILAQKDLEDAWRKLANTLQALRSVFKTAEEGDQYVRRRIMRLALHAEDLVREPTTVEACRSCAECVETLADFLSIEQRATADPAAADETAIALRESATKLERAARQPLKVLLPQIEMITDQLRKANQLLTNTLHLEQLPVVSKPIGGTTDEARILLCNQQEGVLHLKAEGVRADQRSAIYYRIDKTQRIQAFPNKDVTCKVNVPRDAREFVCEFPRQVADLITFHWENLSARGRHE